MSRSGILAVGAALLVYALTLKFRTILSLMPLAFFGVAAMVVLHEGHECEERELQLFVAQRVAGYKVPKKILFVDELPKGATGKLQRIGLAQRIGLGFGSYVSGEF